MMSISPGMAAGQAGGYFSREDYYLRGIENEGRSHWFGRGARALGLEGPVTEESFRALCRGENPEGDRIVAPKLTRDRESVLLVETHRAGNDLTFSAPKSISIAYAAGVNGVREAHDAAVCSVLSHLEEHYSHYRSPEGIRCGDMVAAKFDHATSRNVDPQLHSHVFVVNAVHVGDGSWRANEPRAIFQDQKSLGLLYRQELARELSARGFEVEVRDRSQMFIELKGIDPLLIDHFSSRRQAIEEQVELWRAEGRFTEVPHARLYEMAALESRDPKRSITKEEVTRIFERGFEECSTSFAQVRRDLERGREIAVSRSITDASHVVELAVRDLTEREAVLDRARLLDQTVLISGGEHSVAELNLAIDGGTPGVQRLGHDARGREFYTTREMLVLESRNLERIREFPPFESLARVPEVEAYLEHWQEREGVRLTAGQKTEVLQELTGRRGVALTIGDPGTAKTSTLAIVEGFTEEVLRPEGREHLSFNLSHTGKAARELSLATGKPALTLDSFENENPASKFALQRANGEPPMVVVAGEKFLIPQGREAQVVLRVDEAGFLGARQAEHLLDVAEALRQSGVQVKLHLLGDSKQMQGIQAGDLLRQVRELGLKEEVDYAHLTEILRQRDPGLLEIARGLNREDRELAVNAREALRSLEKRQGVLQIADPSELRRAAVEHYLEESRKLSRMPERAAAGERQQVLLVTTTNDARRDLNLEIRRARVTGREIDEGRNFPVLTPVRQGVTVEGYQLGDTLHFSGERAEDGRTVAWGARLHAEGKVVGLDRELNMVRVNLSFETLDRQRRKVVREVTKEFSAAELPGRTTLLREEERSFSVGDRIVALKNDRRLGVQNGSLGVVREIDGTRMRVDLEGREVTLDLTTYRHLDHAYAVTIQKSQGATVEHSILYAPVQPKKGMELVPGDGHGESYGRMSYNALNVAVTRARFGTRVFTNSIDDLERSVESVDGKSSTLGKAREPVREITHAQQRGSTEPAHDLQRSIGELERVMLKRGEGVRRAPSLEHVIPLVRAPGLKIPEQVLQIRGVQKVVDRQLEKALPKLPGLGL
ncbi:MobF family relaxase [Geomonas edaphica]|uniref:MobF family relaxase n=1 Tax=Geomonas edaphica TaxID=2570226 RepID=UPI0013A5C346|nr:MobF family relaxase [Geomonas edaphica]